MKKYILTIALLILITGFVSEPKTCLAETENNSINLSYEYGGGFCDDLNQFSIEFEHLFKETRISLFGRYNMAEYMKESGTDWLRSEEDGDIKGVDIGFRFYPIGQKRMDKLFIGGAFGFFQNDWKEGYVQEQQVTYSESVTRLDTEIGYRFTTKLKRISITPSAHLGYYSGDDSSLAIYTGISISVGFAF
jgi:hypothetical protein